MINKEKELSEEISESEAKDISKTNTESSNTTKKSSSYKSSKTTEKENEKEKREKKSLNETKIIIKNPLKKQLHFSPNNIIILYKIWKFYQCLFSQNILNNHEYNHMINRKNTIFSAQNYRIFNSNDSILFITNKKEDKILVYLLYYFIFILGKFFIGFSLIIKYKNENPLIIYNIMKSILDMYFPLNSLIPNYFNTIIYKIGFIADQNNNNYFIIQIIIYFQENIFQNALNGNKIYKLIEGNKNCQDNNLNEDHFELIDECENKIITENIRDNIFYKEYNEYYD